MRWAACFFFLLAEGSGGAAQDKSAASEEFFEARIRPVLVEQCVRCHGPKKSSGGLRLDSRATFLRGGQSGPIVVAGQPQKSLLVQALRHEPDAELRMPPDKKLPGHVIADFVAWIQSGAAWPLEKKLSQSGVSDSQHWAFQLLHKPPVPPDPSGWAANPVDCFILAKLQERGLRPMAQADERTLLRRLFLDAIGLPPTPKEIADFELRIVDLQKGAAGDSAIRHSQAAIAELIDRLLASPHRGERWGRHWMDVVRYADTAGDNADYPIPEVRLYRDYIIDAFNRDLPFDQFVREQLAGDILAKQDKTERYAEQVTATGFLALSRRYATAPYELWHLTLEDTIDTVGQAFLGMTLRCARCHDHKFDPVTMRDYYGLYGIFESTQFPWAGGEEFQSMNFPRQHFVALLPQTAAAPRLKEYADRLAKLPTEIGELDKRLAAAAAEEKKSLQDKVAGLKREQLILQRYGLPPELPAAYAVSEGTAHDATVQKRGDPGQPGGAVPRSALAFLPGGGELQIPAGQSGRLQLANWIARPDNPLTARVMVNRIWQHHFGRGLVATPSNFGTRGAAPTHPELLDYLTAVFIESGWSVKTIDRLILTSKTWQLSSHHDPENAAKDTGNLYYWRHDRRRLDAEEIRDSLLSAAGTLNLQRPGAHPFPPIGDWHWTQHNQFKDVYDSPHRSVYLMTQRLQRHPFLALFDGPDTNTTTAQRPVSTVAQQALYLMNSPEMQKLAEAFARRVVAATASETERVRLAHRICYARSATPQEIERAEEYLKRFRQETIRAGMERGQAEQAAWTSYARVLLSANEFIYID